MKMTNPNTPWCSRHGVEPAAQGPSTVQHETGSPRPSSSFMESRADTHASELKSGSSPAPHRAVPIDVHGLVEWTRSERLLMVRPRSMARWSRPAGPGSCPSSTCMITLVIECFGRVFQVCVGSCLLVQTAQVTAFTL